MNLQVKCDQYWPSRGTETYGMIQVTMLDTVELATYSVRTFALYKVRTIRMMITYGIRHWIGSKKLNVTVSRSVERAGELKRLSS